MALAVAWFGARPNGVSLVLAMALGGLVYGVALAAAYPASALKAAGLLQGFRAKAVVSTWPARLRGAAKEKS